MSANRLGPTHELQARDQHSSKSSDTLSQEQQLPDPNAQLHTDGPSGLKNNQPMSQSNLRALDTNVRKRELNKRLVLDSTTRVFPRMQAASGIDGATIVEADLIQLGPLQFVWRACESVHSLSPY